MEENEDSIPVRIALLTVGYISRTLSEAEQDELDDWISKSLDNQKVFEDAIEMTRRPVQPGLDEEETDDSGGGNDLEYTAALIIRHLNHTITDEESKTLNEWVALSPSNAELLASLPKTADMETLFNELRMRVIETHYRQNLN